MSCSKLILSRSEEKVLFRIKFLFIVKPASQPTVSRDIKNLIVLNPKLSYTTSNRDFMAQHSNSTWLIIIWFFMWSFSFSFIFLNSTCFGSGEWLALPGNRICQGSDDSPFLERPKNRHHYVLFIYHTTYKTKAHLKTHS